MASTTQRVEFQVRFFASLRDAVGRSSLEVRVDSADADGCISVARLLGLVRENLDADGFAALSAENVRIAVNQRFLPDRDTTGQRIPAGAEVAFMPPVTGG